MKEFGISSGVGVARRVVWVRRLMYIAIGVCTREFIVMIIHEHNVSMNMEERKSNCAQTTVPAFDAIRGHRSACQSNSGQSGSIGSPRAKYES
jgi:hypothetical protein